MYLIYHALQFVATHSQEPILYISSELQVQRLSAGSLKLTMVGVFMPWKSANAAFPFYFPESPLLCIYQHMAAYHQSINPLLICVVLHPWFYLSKVEGVSNFLAPLHSLHHLNGHK